MEKKKNKMNQKKGNATILLLAKIAFLLFAMTSNTAHATTYTVGDSTGWIFNLAGWENGKSFKAGDTLGKLILFLFDKELINNNSLIISIYIYIYLQFSITLPVGIVWWWWWTRRVTILAVCQQTRQYLLRATIR